MGDEEAEVVLPKVKKCLIVMTSAETLSDESPTGYYLSEVVHPYNTFIAHGWEVAFASIAGTAVADPASVEAADPETAAFWDDGAKKALLDAPTKLADIPIETATAEYEALYFAGGFGCMVDFAECAEAQALIKAFVEGEGKIVFANIEAGEGKVRAPARPRALAELQRPSRSKQAQQLLMRGRSARSSCARRVRSCCVTPRAFAVGSSSRTRRSRPLPTWRRRRWASSS
jgi:hypothetical protein